ncbi:MAG TPA: hypothetical protein VF765_18150 [Polyangiaceae bacterium]
MAARATGFQIAQRAVKGVGIAAGALCTFVAFSSVVGLATGNGWARGIVGLILTLALPAVVVDRTLPKPEHPPKAGRRPEGPHNAVKPRPGMVGDAIAIVLLGVALVFVGFGQPLTRPLLVHEGDRYAEDGHDVLAHVVYFLAGVRPVDAPPKGDH